MSIRILDSWKSHEPRQPTIDIIVKRYTNDFNYDHPGIRLHLKIFAFYALNRKGRQTRISLIAGIIQFLKRGDI